jgi:hypothetical protein
VFEAEAATLGGPATVVQPESAWTGESLWSGGAYVNADDGGSIVFDLPAHEQDRWVEPVVELEPSLDAGRSTWTGGGERLGRIDHGRVGEQGISPAPGSLQAIGLRNPLPAGETSLEMRSDGPTRVDAVLVRPLVGRIVLTGTEGAATALLASSARQVQRVAVDLPGSGLIVVQLYDDRSRLRAETTTDQLAEVRVLPGGFHGSDPLNSTSSSTTS